MQVKSHSLGPADTPGAEPVGEAVGPLLDLLIGESAAVVPKRGSAGDAIGLVFEDAKSAVRRGQRLWRARERDQAATPLPPRS